MLHYLIKIHNKEAMDLLNNPIWIYDRYPLIDFKFNQYNPRNRVSLHR